MPGISMKKPSMSRISPVTILLSGVTMQKADGMRYAPQGKAKAVCRPGEFRFAAIGLDHGHIYGMCNGLTEAGGELVSVYDPDPAKVADFCKIYPGVKPAASEQEILDDAT